MVGSPGSRSDWKPLSCSRRKRCRLDQRVKPVLLNIQIPERKQETDRAGPYFSCLHKATFFCNDPWTMERTLVSNKWIIFIIKMAKLLVNVKKSSQIKTTKRTEAYNEWLLKLLSEQIVFWADFTKKRSEKPNPASSVLELQHKTSTF